MERLPNEVLDNTLGFYKTMMEMCKDTDKKDCPSILDRATVLFLEELKEYRRLEKEGLILKLPCKEGDTVYTINSYTEVAKDIARIKPETIIITSPHAVMYRDYFHISPREGARGNFANFRAAHVEFDVKYDEELQTMD